MPKELHHNHTMAVADRERSNYIFYLSEIANFASGFLKNAELFIHQVFSQSDHDTNFVPLHTYVEIIADLLVFLFSVEAHSLKLKMKVASPRSGDEVANGFQKKIDYSSRNASISSLVSK